MKEASLFLRLREGMICLGLVMWDNVRGLLASRRASRYEGTGAGHRPRPDVFPPGDWRRKALDDFTSWLKGIDSPASAPPTPDFSCDLFSVVTELAGLRHEIKRQSREQAKASEGLAQLDERYREGLARLGSQSENLASFRQDVQEETERSVFLLFADLRDALQRGLDEARAASRQKSFFRKPTASWEAAEAGYKLALARFDRAMASLGIRKVPTSGHPFDSRLMVAIAARHDPAAEIGTVLEEALSGYIRGDEVLRAAHVVVASDETV